MDRSKEPGGARLRVCGLPRPAAPRPALCEYRRQILRTGTRPSLSRRIVMVFSSAEDGRWARTNMVFSGGLEFGRVSLRHAVSLRRDESRSATGDHVPPRRAFVVRRRPALRIRLAVSPPLCPPPPPPP